MRKSLLTLLLIVSMLFSTVGTYAKGEIDTYAEKTSERSAQILCAIGALDEIYEQDKQLTRRDFADIMYTVLGGKRNNHKFDSSYFDVPNQDPGYYAIGYLQKMGCISSGEFFRPDDKILKTEALKILVSVLGLNEKAEYTGGYPFGYISLATKNAIIPKDFNFDTELGYYEACDMILRTIKCNVTFVKGIEHFSKNGTIVKYDYDRPFLEIYYGITVIEGIVNGNEIFSIDKFDAQFNSSHLYINDRWYKYDDVKMRNYVGYNVEAYVKDIDTENCILAMEPIDTKVDIIEIKSINSVTRDYVEYFNENNKLKKIMLEDSISYVENFKRTMLTDLNTQFKTGNGFLKLIDNDDDEYVDVVFKMTYRNFFVSEVDVESQKIFSDVNDEYISFEQGYYILKDGKEVLPENLEYGTILTIFDNGIDSYFFAYASNKAVQGKVTSLIDDECVINNETYRLGDGVKVQLGEEGKWFLNYFDEIVIKKHLFGMGDNYGYIFNIGKIGALNNNLMIKMFTSMGFLEILTCRDKITLDGRKDVKSSGISPSYLVNQPVRFETDGKGYVKEIDTRIPDAGGDDDYFSRDAEKANYIYKTTGIFGGKYAIKADTIVIGIPLDSSNEDEYRLMNFGHFKADTYYDMEFYNLSDVNIADFAICYENNEIGTSEPCIIVDDIIKVLGDNEVVYTRINGISNGEKVYYDVDSKKYPVFDTLQRGDIIRVGVGVDGKIHTYEINYKVGGTNSGANQSTPNHAHRIVIGTFVGYEDGKLLINDNGTKYLFDISGKVIYEYKQEDGRDMIEEINPLELDSNNTIFIQTGYSTVKGIYVY